MGNFSRDKRSGGGFGGGRGFNKRDSGPRSFGPSRSFGGRDGGRPQMHQAVCSDCGKDCEVPFRPTGDRPIYCSDCFGNQNQDGFARKPERDGGRSFGRGSFEDKKMYDAVCAKCGDDCQVPFRPTGDKPVYCSNCFDKGDRTRGGDRDKGTDQYQGQLAAINSKLDQILKALNVTGVAEAVPAKKAAKKAAEVKAVEVKVAEVKTAVKKVAKKKKK